MTVTEFWDQTLKPKMMEVCKREDLDAASVHYISQAIFYVEHDLADGKGDDMTKFRLMNVNIVLHRQSFYDDVIKDNESLEVDLREIARDIKSLMEM